MAKIRVCQSSARNASDLSIRSVYDWAFALREGDREFFSFHYRVYVEKRLLDTRERPPFHFLSMEVSRYCCQGQKAQEVNDLAASSLAQFMDALVHLFDTADVVMENDERKRVLVIIENDIRNLLASASITGFEDE